MIHDGDDDESDDDNDDDDDDDGDDDDDDDIWWRRRRWWSVVPVQSGFLPLKRCLQDTQRFWAELHLYVGLSQTWYQWLFLEDKLLLIKWKIWYFFYFFFICCLIYDSFVRDEAGIAMTSLS